MDRRRARRRVARPGRRPASTGSSPRPRALLERGDVALVGHGHCLRVVGARWIGLPPSGGGALRLDTATLSALGLRARRGAVILEWNSGR